MKSKVRLTLLLLFMACSASGQNFKSEIETIKKSFENTNALHLVMKIQIFDDSVSAKASFIEKVDIKRQENNFRYVMNAYEMLMNETYLIVVNKDASELMYTVRDLKTEKLLQSQFNLNMDTVFNILGTPEFVAKKGNADHYVLKRKTGSIRQIDFFLNKEKKIMERVEYRYRENQVVFIEFELFDAAPAFDDKTFVTSNYLIFSGREIKTSPAFANYKIIQSETE